LDVFDLLDEPSGGFAEDRGGGLGGVTDPFGGFAGLVPLGVAVGPGIAVLGGVDVSGDPAVGPGDGSGQLAVCPAVGVRGEEWVGEQPVDRFEQGEVAVGVERGDDRGAGIGLSAGEEPGESGRNGPEDEVVG
jgi:hypothetical protein